MRSATEIADIHDLLEAVLDHPPITLEAHEREIIAISLNVLCWVLKHGHNPSFEEAVAGLQAEIRKAESARVN